MNSREGRANKADGKALIIGASSGIGREMARRLAADGWLVAASGRRAELLRSLSEEAPGRIIASAFDLNETSRLPEALSRAVEGLEGLDLAVISAGTGFLNPGLDPELERQTIDTNVLAFTLAADWLYDFFRKQGRGHLAAITSVGGLAAEGAAPAYPAAKAYQIMYLKSLRQRAGKEVPALTVTELRPGSVRTDMMKGEGHFWISSPEEAARLACQAIYARKNLQYISRRWSLIGLALRLGSIFS